VKIGDIELVPLNDGTVGMPPAYYANMDWEAHADLLAEDGKFHIPVGCFLVRTGERTLLLDAGIGPLASSLGVGGQLPSELAAAGVTPGDIDEVICTHLHLDHAGWLVHEGQAFFPNATVRFGAGDWQQFVTDADPQDHIRVGMELLAEQGRLEPIEGDMVALAPGVTARYTPGHTNGHYGLIVSSGDERVYLLGDAVECPLQLEEPDFYILSDVDPDLARRTRETLWQELEGTSALVGAAHFPGLEFGRVMAGNGKRWFTPA
jgi:glyoxylase-like metal-dependent hydrolase (beta-lactamase superfamily II)